FAARGSKNARGPIIRGRGDSSRSQLVAPPPCPVWTRTTRCSNVHRLHVALAAERGEVGRRREGAARMGDAGAARGLLLGCTGVLAASLLCGQAIGADRAGPYDWQPTLALEPEEPTAVEPAPTQAAGSRYQVTAREWISAVSKLEAHNNSVSTTQMFLYGGSISYVPPWDSGVAFLFSAYYGDSIGYSNFFDANSQGSSTLQRLDVEALVQVPIIATVYGSFGLRYIDFKRDDNGTAHGYYVDGNGQLQPFTVAYKRLTDYQYFLGEIGIASVTTLDEDKKHRTFGGVMF